ncbi:MAG: hypothetical protein EAZ47_07785 [Bacteroidetes bacterium]|nr:MAG: hypothetical protein EAY72_02960 [Bacteroidota bacterium]TAE70951.1 MAG: hypothetical protein EAY68_02375 [Bacteroidota bacterium]TAF92974.1 MAG: hypothetical protein EAZ47_07785 [Bacteroidota bacterium]
MKKSLILSFLFAITHVQGGIFCQPYPGNHADFNPIDSIGNQLAEGATSKIDQVDKINTQAYYALSNNLDEAEKFALKASLLSNEIKYETGIIVSYHMLGQLALKRLDYNKALDQFLKAKQFADKPSNLKWLSLVYDDMGDVYFAIENYYRAVYFYSISIRKAELYNGDESYYYACRSMADAYRELKNIDSAVLYYKRCKPYFDRKEAGSEQGLYYLSMAKNYYRAFLNDSTDKYYALAIPILEKFKMSYELYDAHKFLGYRHWRMTELNQCKVHFDKAEEVGRNLNNAIVNADLKSCRGDYFSLAKNYDSARYYYSAALLEYKLLNLKTRALFCFGHLMEIAQKLNDGATISTMHDELLNINYIPDQLSVLSQIEEKLAREEFFTSEKEIDVLEDRNALQKQRIFFLIVFLMILSLGIVILIYYAIQRNKAIYEIKDLQRQTEIAFKKEEEHNVIKSKLLFILSHDLRSPLTTVQGLLSLQSKGAMTPQELITHFDTLSTEVQNSIFLLDNLLQWIKTQLEGATITTAPVYFASLINECLQIYKYATLQKQLTIKVNVQTTTCHSDENILRIVMRNVLGNAIKYSPSGTAIEITTQPKGDYTELCIIDNGKGIPEAALEKIREGKPITTRLPGTEKGAGVGLLFSIELLRRINATYKIDTNTGTGTRFSILIPAGK